MGRPALGVSYLVWHLCGFLGGYLSSDLLQGYQVQRELKETTEAVARAASQAAASRCVDALEEICCQEDRKSRPGSKRPAGPKLSAPKDFVWVWVLVISLCNWLFGGLCSLCYYCCRRAPPTNEPEEGEESPTSPLEQRVLAQQQLAALRLRRHDIGRSAGAGAL